MLRKLPLTHPVTGKGSTPSRKGLEAQWPQANSTAVQPRLPRSRDRRSIPRRWPSGAERVGSGLVLGGWSPTLQAREALGPSACPPCPLTLPRVLPVAFSWPRLEVCGKQCLRDVFSRCFCCCFTSQLKGRFQTWPIIPDTRLRTGVSPSPPEHSPA